MKDFYLSDCAKFENQTFDTYFVVAAKQIKNKKDGAPYLALTLADKDGQIEAKMWDNVGDALTTVEQDDYVKVRGLLNKYNGRFQFTIHKIRRCADSEVEAGDFLPKTKKDIEELWATLQGFLSTIEHEPLRALMFAFVEDEEIASAYKVAPAAKSLHHAFIGGLLEHDVSLITLCDLVVRNYPMVNRDLVIAGAFLHDIGKIYELGFARSFSYTTKGQLVGHINMGLEMMHAKLTGFPDFPEEMKTVLEHLVISHHGELEFGSPKVPMCPEALLLHYCDNLDSKMEAMRAQFERDAISDSVWTSYNPSLGRTLLNTQRFLAPPKVEEKAVAAVAAAQE